MRTRWRRPFLLAGATVLAGLLAGCALRPVERDPRGPYIFYHPQLPAAESAVEAARAAGKDRECPEAFAAAEKLMQEAYEIYWACRTVEAVATAKRAAARAAALCPPSAGVPRAVPPPRPPSPSVELSSSPSAIRQGQCTTLRWSSANATAVRIDQGIGAVPPAGSQQVCPTGSTSYLITATGPGGSQTASTTVGVTPPPPPAPAPAVERLTLRINFDTDAADIRPADIPQLERALEFVRRHPGRKISIEGHTDNVGRARYNQGLSERRAAAVKAYLLKGGVPAGERISTIGHGESRPVADNGTASGRFENRRVEIIVLPE